MRPLPGWSAVKAAHTSKGAVAGLPGCRRAVVAVVAGGPAAGLAICMQISAVPANLHQPGRPAGYTHSNYQCTSGLCACGRALWVSRLPSTCTRESSSGRTPWGWVSKPHCRFELASSGELLQLQCLGRTLHQLNSTGGGAGGWLLFSHISPGNCNLQREWRTAAFGRSRTAGEIACGRTVTTAQR